MNDWYLVGEDAGTRWVPWHDQQVGLQWIGMIQANIHEAKTQLSHLIEQALRGKKVVIAKRNRPLIELKPLQKKMGKRKLGQYKHTIELTDAFFEPMPDDLLEAFNNPK